MRLDRQLEVLVSEINELTSIKQFLVQVASDYNQQSQQSSSSSYGSFFYRFKEQNQTFIFYKAIQTHIIRHQIQMAITPIIQIIIIETISITILALGKSKFLLNILRLIFFI